MQVGIVEDMQVTKTPPAWHPGEDGEDIEGGGEGRRHQPSSAILTIQNSAGSVISMVIIQPIINRPPNNTNAPSDQSLDVDLDLFINTVAMTVTSVVGKPINAATSRADIFSNPTFTSKKPITIKRANAPRTPGVIFF